MTLYIHERVSAPQGGGQEAMGVAVYLDFENLIYGLIDRYGEQGAYEHFKVQRILDYATRFGPIRVAKAYADWRVKSVNRFQTELYGRGVELVHVLGRGNKNAVDMKMACSALGTETSYRS